MQRVARFSADGDHRLMLGRRWADGPTVAFIGLNPSTGDGEADDPTIRRCIGFAQAWGYGSLLVGNLFTFCTPDPRLLSACKSPLAMGADNALRDIADASDLVIECWGAHRMAAARVDHVRTVIDERAPRAALGLTQGGAPRHPLYAPAGILPSHLTVGPDGLRLGRPIDLPGGAVVRRRPVGDPSAAAALAPEHGVGAGRRV